LKRTSLTLIAFCAMLLWVGAGRAASKRLPVSKAPSLALARLCGNNLRTCLTGRFTDNGDGTITDHQTGLMWEKKTGTTNGNSDPNDVRNVNNLYPWCTGSSTSCTNTDGLADGPAFTVFLATLNNGVARFNGENPGPATGCFANHCDWRLPSAVELFGIVDRSAPGCSNGEGACIPPVFGPTQIRAYWSASTDAAGPDLALDVEFGNGVANDELKYLEGYVRAVRGVQ
jgi:hypothetical protein